MNAAIVFFYCLVLGVTIAATYTFLKAVYNFFYRKKKTMTVDEFMEEIKEW